jgi:hypothetical protein
MMEHIPYGSGSIGLLHQGRHTSVLRNHSPDTIYWQAFMEARYDQWMINLEEKLYDGAYIDWYGQMVLSWFLAVPPGETFSISAFQGSIDLPE